jgi:hypothetical protein
VIISNEIGPWVVVGHFWLVEIKIGIYTFRWGS